MKKLVNQTKSLKTLRENPDAWIIISCMEFLNDFNLLGHLTQYVNQWNDGERTRTVVGAEFYFHRILIAHCHEMLVLVRHIESSHPKLKEALELHPECSEAYKTIADIARKTANGKNSQIMQLASDVRTKGTFHYFDHQNKRMPIWIAKSLERLDEPNKIKDIIEMFENKPEPRRFPIADDVIHNILVEEIFQPAFGESDRNEAFRKFYEEMTLLAKNLNNVCHTIVEIYLKSQS